RSGALEMGLPPRERARWALGNAQMLVFMVFDPDGKPSGMEEMISRGFDLILGVKSRASPELMASTTHSSYRIIIYQIDLRSEDHHILHIVQAGRLLIHPQRGPYRTFGEGHTALGFVGNFHPLTFGGEHDGMITDHITATNGFKTNLLLRARAGVAFTTI